jgi:hypothetical protein
MDFPKSHVYPKRSWHADVLEVCSVTILILVDGGRLEPMLARSASALASGKSGGSLVRLRLLPQVIAIEPFEHPV